MFQLITAYWPFVVLVAMVLAAIALLRMYAGPQRLPYRKRGRLLTNAEIKFFRALQKSVQDDWLIFSMVRIADLVVVSENIKQRRSWLGRIASKHVDFVLCDAGSVEPKLAIELDDPTHERPDRIKRDEFVEQVFESSGIPLIRIKLASSYDSRALRQVIDEQMKRN